MRKLIIATIFVFICTNAFAVGTCSVTSSQLARLSSFKTTVSMVTVGCTADVADASFPVQEITGIGGFVLGVCVDEGTTGTDGTISMSLKLDGTDVDILGDHGTSVSTSAGYACVTPSNVQGDNYVAPFAGNLDFQITGGGVNSANPNIYIMFGE